MKNKFFYILFLFLLFGQEYTLAQNKTYNEEVLKELSLSDFNLYKFIKENKNVLISFFDEKNMLMSFSENYLVLYFNHKIHLLNTELYTENYYKYKIFNGKKAIGFLLVEEVREPLDSLKKISLYINTSFFKDNKSLNKSISFIPLKEEVIQKEFLYRIDTSEDKRFTKEVFLKNKGNFLKKIGFSNSAILLFDQSIKLYPQNPIAYLNMGNSYWSLMKKSDAQIYYKQFIKIIKKQHSYLKIPEYVYLRVKEPIKIQ